MRDRFSARIGVGVERVEMVACVVPGTTHAGVRVAKASQLRHPMRGITVGRSAPSAVIPLHRVDQILDPLPRLGIQSAR